MNFNEVPGEKNIFFFGIKIKIIISKDRKKYFLFNLPILEKRNSNNKFRIILFNMFQIFKKEVIENIINYKLIGIINIKSIFTSHDEIINEYYEKNKILLPHGDKAKIYFLFHSKAFWPSWNSFYQACIMDKNVITKIIFCPAKEQSEGKNGQFEDAELWLDKNNIPYIHIKDIDFKYDKPHVVVMQTPYDYGHRIPIYWSENFKKNGVRVVYISYGLEFTEAKSNIRNHFQLMIHIHAWRIFTFCENLVRDYKKYCPSGANHVRCVGHPKFDALFEVKSHSLPQELIKKIDGRKTICWHVHFPCEYSTVNGENTLSTLSWNENIKIMNYIKEDKKNFYIFMPHHMFFGVFNSGFKIPNDEISRFKQTLENGQNSTIWYGDYPIVLANVDAFIGERSAVTMEMVTMNKPICYVESNPEIYNEFGNDVIRSSYYASNADDVIKFLKIIDNNDYKYDYSNINKKYIEKYFDGKCGERIKNEVLNSLYAEHKV